MNNKTFMQALNDSINKELSDYLAFIESDENHVESFDEKLTRMGFGVDENGNIAKIDSEYKIEFTDPEPSLAIGDVISAGSYEERDKTLIGVDLAAPGQKDYSVFKPYVEPPKLTQPDMRLGGFEVSVDLLMSRDMWKLIQKMQLVITHTFSTNRAETRVCVVGHSPYFEEIDADQNVPIYDVALVDGEPVIKGIG